MKNDHFLRGSLFSLATQLASLHVIHLLSIFIYIYIIHIYFSFVDSLLVCQGSLPSVSKSLKVSLISIKTSLPKSCLSLKGHLHVKILGHVIIKIEPIFPARILACRDIPNIFLDIKEIQFQSFYCLSLFLSSTAPTSAAFCFK